MQRIHKTLAICLLLTALVFGVLKILGGVGLGAEGKNDAKTKSRDMVTRHEKGDSDSSTRKSRLRARKLSSTEAREFLKTIVIPEIYFENITLEDALKIVNEEIAKQTPEDQRRPRILLDPKYPSPTMLRLHDDGGYIVETVRLRNVPVSDLLQNICDYANTCHWFYKGDYYLGSAGSSDIFFYNEEKLSRLKLENIDASQLALRLNEVIEHHEYFGLKTGIDIMMTGKARDALLKGEVKLPRINLNLENVTLSQLMMIIEEQTGGALVVSEHEQRLLFNPFNQKTIMDAFDRVEEGGSFDIPLNEDTMNPNFIPVKNPFE